MAGLIQDKSQRAALLVVEVFRLPVALQRFSNDLLAYLDAIVPQFYQHRRVSLPRKNGVDNRQSGHAGDFTNHVMDLEIHLCQCLLHVLNVLSGHLHQIGAVAYQRSYSAYVAVGPEGGSQQPYGM